MDSLSLDVVRLKPFITLKLSGADLDEVLKAIPPWSDRQARTAVELLKRPSGDFYPSNQPWSLDELEKICREEGYDPAGKTDPPL